jgi:phosphoribosylamine--glycine ligase
VVYANTVEEDSTDNPLISKVFHAGTAEKNGQVITAGGRVLCAVGLGDTVSEAQARAYELTKRITWDKVYYRTDIGYRAIAREQANNQVQDKSR